MAYQATFKRYEIKYLLTKQQKNAILRAMQPYMELDQYGVPPSATSTMTRIPTG